MGRIGELNYKEIGNRIRNGRLEAQMTQQELSKLVGVSTSFIGHLERAEKIPSVDTLVQLCAAMDMTMDYLIFGKKQKCDKEKCELFLDLQTLITTYAGNMK